MNEHKTLLVLAEGGHIRFSLYRKPAQHAEAILQAADELLYHLRIGLGQPIPEQDASYPVKLLLDYDVCADLEKEQFEITADERQLALRASTCQGMFHAVYYVLETVFGVRWLWPGASGEVIPRLERAAVPIGTMRDKPDFAWRVIQTGGAIYGAMDYNTMLHAVLQRPLSERQAFATWCRRNRFGGLHVADGHRWSEMAPPETYGRSHPEWYALANGKRDNMPGNGKHGNQPCLTDPGTIGRMAQYAMATFAAQPELDVFSLGLNDGGHSCECARCLAFDHEAKSEGVTAPEHFDAVTRETADDAKKSRSVTDRVIWNANEVAREVKRRFPDKKLLVLLYSHFRLAPVTHRPDDQVIGQFCIMGNMFWNERIRAIEMKRLRDMGECVRHLGIYEYYANGAWPEIHRLFPDIVETSVRDYYKAGARFFATQPSEGFAVNGLNLYMLGRMLWNVDANAEEIMADYCRAGFAAASGSVLSFYKAFAERWRETESGLKLEEVPEPRLACALLYDERFIRDRQDELDRANEQASGDSAAKERIQFLQYGLDYTRLYCRAAAETLQLYRSCGARHIKELKQAELPMELVRLALQAWEQYWQFVERHQGQFVFGDFWVHYRPGVYGSKDATLALLREKLAAAASEPAS